MGLEDIAEGQWQQIARELNIASHPENLEYVVPGTTVELQTFGAAIYEVKLRCGVGPNMLILDPAVAVVLGSRNEQDPSDREWHVFLASVEQATEILVPVWAPNPAHYTYLQAVRSSPADSWTLTYADSLPSPVKNNIVAAKRIARRLGLWREGRPWSANAQKEVQPDGWSCGLFVLRWIEARARQYFDGQVAATDSINTVIGRVNRFVEMLRIHGSTRQARHR